MSAEEGNAEKSIGNADGEFKIIITNYYFKTCFVLGMKYTQSRKLID
jgi:hypothetical protein